MKVKELTALTPDKIVIYTDGSKECEYNDLYRGFREKIPADLQDRDVKMFGAIRSCVEIYI